MYSRAHMGQDRVSGEPCTGLPVALVLDFQGYSLSQVSRRSGGDGGRGWGRVPPWGGAPGVQVPCLSLWSCAGGCAKGKSSAGQGGLSSCLGRVRMAAGQGSAFSWPSPGTGGLEHPLVALSKAGRAFLSGAQPLPGRGVGELEGGVDRPPTVGTGAWALVPALPEHLVGETPATGRGLASLPSAVEKGSPGSWERRAELWGLVGSGQSQPGR